MRTPEEGSQAESNVFSVGILHKWTVSPPPMPPELSSVSAWEWGDLSWYPEPLDPMACDPPEGGVAAGLLEWQWIDRSHALTSTEGRKSRDTRGRGPWALEKKGRKCVC